MKDLLNLCLPIIFIFSAFLTNAQQDCTLGVGGKDTETITKVFQLNEEQQGKMEAWVGELSVKNKLIEDQITQLFDNHPQSTPEELETLAKKYKVLQQKMVDLSREYDIKLLSIFNERQYKRYVELCSEALRRPFIVIPSSYKDTVADPK